MAGSYRGATLWLISMPDKTNGPYDEAQGAIFSVVLIIKLLGQPDFYVTHMVLSLGASRTQDEARTLLAEGDQQLDVSAKVIGHSSNAE